MNKFFLIVLLAFVMTGCQSYKKVPYLQDAEAVSHGVQNEQLYDAKIMPKDLLTIVVSCTSPELAAPFNLTVATQGNVASNYTTAQPVLQQYLVDNEGKINFPVLGELHVGGLTKKATEQMIVEKLKPYMKEPPIVTVRMVNYKISVIGEVARPGTFTISNEKVNLLLNSIGISSKNLFYTKIIALIKLLILLEDNIGIFLVGEKCMAKSSTYSLVFDELCLVKSNLPTRPWLQGNANKDVESQVKIPLEENTVIFEEVANNTESEVKEIIEYLKEVIESGKFLKNNKQSTETKTSFAIIGNNSCDFKNLYSRKIYFSAFSSWRSSSSNLASPPGK